MTHRHSLHVEKKTVHYRLESIARQRACNKAFSSSTRSSRVVVQLHETQGAAGSSGKTARARERTEARRSRKSKRTETKEGEREPEQSIMTLDLLYFLSFSRVSLPLHTPTAALPFFPRVRPFNESFDARPCVRYIYIYNEALIIFEKLAHRACGFSSFFPRFSFSLSRSLVFSPPVGCMLEGWAKWKEREN